MPPTLPNDRYETRGALGSGAMGEVLRVYDQVLRRDVAMKIGRGDVTPAGRIRFFAEAQATAQLAHPAIVPVYDLGSLPGGEPFYTMPVVGGRTLRALIEELHGPEGNRLPVRRVLAHFHDVCEAVAYAHHRGVIHRDLKPENVVVGDYGETFVVDWGLAKVRGEEPTIHTARLDDDSADTLHGTIAGTPGYLAPEQAHGQIDLVGPPTDVHALGAMLQEILTGDVPYPGTPFQAVDRALNGVAVPIATEHVPGELAALVTACLQRDPAARPRDAGAVARAVGDWLEGARRRERALAAVAEADALAAQAAGHRREAELAEGAARVAAIGVAVWDGADRKRDVWRLEDVARAHAASASVREVEWQQALEAALREEPTLLEAHDRLADFYRDRHAAAEEVGDQGEASRLLPRLRAHGGDRHAVYLRGVGRFTLTTAPAGAEVVAWRFEERDRRLVPVRHGVVGTTPLTAELGVGSWRLDVTAPGFPTTRVPIVIRRGGHWRAERDGVDVPVPLPGAGDLGDDEIYIPGGPFGAGGDPFARDPLPRSDPFVGGFVARRFVVTVGEHRAFLRALAAAGRWEEAREHAPREQGSPDPFFHFDGSDVVAGPDLSGHVLPDRWPMVLIPYDTCVAHAAWLAETTGLPWRLPTELEWEKAARGVDRRSYPWGDPFDPCRAHLQASRPGAPSHAEVDLFPEDESPYGVRGAAGLVAEFCADGPSPDARVVRGGSFMSSDRPARCASRAVLPTTRNGLLGFRLVRSWPG